MASPSQAAEDETPLVNVAHPTPGVQVPAPTPALTPVPAVAPTFIPPTPLPTTGKTKVALVLTGIVYLGLGIYGIVLFAKGGNRWAGGVNTLTWVLAVVGAVFSILSRVLFAQCQAAALQSIGSKAITGGVSLSCLHKMDIGVRGPMTTLFKKPSVPWGWAYKVVIPGLAILTSFTFKKSFGPGIADLAENITGSEATTVDPTHVGTGIRGTSYAGAIIYNTTASVGNNMNPSQKSWTYLVTNISDETGLLNVLYYMPSLPTFVAAGSSGYVSYTANDIPSLLASVVCSNQSYTIGDSSGGIENYDNNITVTRTTDGVAIIQVMTAADIMWSCTSTLWATSGNFTFSSDTNGNWNVSSLNSVQVTALKPFDTTVARWKMMAYIISDALSTTAGYSGWDWTIGTPASVGYSKMLLSTRLSFAAATLGFSQERASPGPKITSGQAYFRENQVTIHANWALVITTILLLVQSVIPLLHVYRLGEFQIDFGILQIMEMRVTAIRNQQDYGPQLNGHCSKYRSSSNVLRDIDNRYIAIKTSGGNGLQHLALVEVDSTGGLVHGNQPGGSNAGNWDDVVYSDRFT